MSKLLKTARPVYEHSATSHDIYLAIAGHVEQVLAEAEINGVNGEEDSQIKILQADLAFDASRVILDHIRDDGYEATSVSYPIDEEVFAEFRAHGHESPYLRLMEIDNDSGLYNVTVRIGGYKVVYTTPTLVEV
jgi:hypothetical protein